MNIQIMEMIISNTDKKEAPIILKQFNKVTKNIDISMPVMVIPTFFK